MAEKTPPRPITLLCFDYGTKRIGVAVGQTLTNTATPVGVISSHQGRPDWKRLALLIEQWRPQALIVGNPLKMDGERQAITAQADRFARQLKGRFALPVHLADERLTSVEALAREGKRKDIDPVAAQIILEGWLGQRADRRSVMI